MNNSLVCVDASIIVDQLLGFDDLPLHTQWQAWIERDVKLIAPRLVRYEVTNVLYQIAKKGQLSREVVAETIHVLITLPITLFDDPFLHDSAFTLARELSLGATYDAHYLALAKQQACEFWTRDAKLVRATQQKYDWIRLLD